MRVRKTVTAYQQVTESEIGTIRKSWKARIRVSLVYPNRYQVGISNLGFQAVYQLLNNMTHVVCERAFLPEISDRAWKKIRSLESGRPLTDFDLIAFSVSFENDFLNLLTVLKHAGIPLKAEDRNTSHPMIIAGGVACFINPEPISPFIDAILIGEAEAVLPGFMAAYTPTRHRRSLLQHLARHVPGVYVPACYHVRYNRDGTLKAFDARGDYPLKIRRMVLRDLNRLPTHSTILSPHTAFNRTFLIEVGRGCPHGCRFCAAGYVYRPPRFRNLSQLKRSLARGQALTHRIGLVGAAVSDLPHIGELCNHSGDSVPRLSFSSLRADALTPEMVQLLKSSGVKTATIAPDAGSERMRRVINKGLSEAQIISAVETLVRCGIPNLKLYFMTGLPTETMEDIEAIILLCRQIKKVFLQASRPHRRIGQITVSVNSFIPKPVTPFQWSAMHDPTTLRKKIKLIRAGLKGQPNVRVHAEDPRRSQIQAILSRGNRQVAALLDLACQHNGNWAQSLKETRLNTTLYTQREINEDELLPWDFIDHGIKKSFLLREYRKALDNRLSAPCPMEACTTCGVCVADSE